MTSSPTMVLDTETHSIDPRHRAMPLLRSSLIELVVLIAFLGLIVYPTVLLYLPLIRNGFFVSDDHILLREATMAIGWQAWPDNPWIFSGMRHFAMWRPAGTLTWFWNAFATTTNPAWYYWVNLGLHLVNALLVLVLIRCLGLGIVGGLVGAAVFALHPIATETVGWLAARFDLVATAFALATLIAQLASNRLSNSHVAGSGRMIAALLFAVSLLAKESAVVIPVIAVLCALTIEHSGEVGQLDGSRPRLRLATRLGRAFRATSALWVVTIVYVVVRYALLGTLGGYGEYLSTTAFRIVENLAHHSRMVLFVPFDRDAYVTPNLYEPTGLLVAPIVIPALCLVIAAILWKHARLGLAIVAITLLPVITISGGGRIVYIATVGYAIAWAAVVTGSAVALIAIGRRLMPARYPAAVASTHPHPNRSASLAYPAWLIACVSIPLCLVVVALLQTYTRTAQPRLQAWIAAGEVIRSLPGQARALYPALPAGARIYVRGLPDSNREIYIFRNVTRLPFDVDAPANSPPQLDDGAWSSPRFAAIVPITSFPTTVPREEVCRTYFAQYERSTLTWQPVPIDPTDLCAAVDDPLPLDGAVTTRFTFEHGIRLAGYRLGSPILSPGTPLRIDLAWSTTEAPGRNYKSFVHIVGKDGPPIAQRDAEPYDGRFPTGVWRAGMTLRDRHLIPIPPTLPPGEYTIYIGWYAYPEPVRLKAFDNDQPVGDAVRLTTIAVVP